VTIHGPKPPVAWKFLPAAIEVLELDVPDRAVVEAGVAEDVAQGVGFSDVPARLPDDEGQFALVVEIARDLGAHHRLIVRDQGIDEPQEDRRVLRRGAAGLGGVGTIIAAGADDLVRVGDRRQQGDLRQRDIRRPALYLGCGGA